MTNTFKTKETWLFQNERYDIFNLNKLPSHSTTRLPYSLKILLENLLRMEDGISVRREDIEALLAWDPTAVPKTEIAFTPSRVILQDFTGVPAVVDLAAMREAMTQLGSDPKKINPLSPVELVIDHSVMVDHFGSPDAFQKNTAIEIQRNQERYVFLRWGQKAFQNFKVVPPGTGIVHQVNLEYLARVLFIGEKEGRKQAFPDTLVGTDSHTTMINGLGVLGWGVGGIEAEAAMLGQPITMLLPQVVGFELVGALPPGATATDLVLTITQILRQKGVVGKFVEFFGEGLSHLPLADRATIANMAPEYGATCGLFPIDEETLRFLALTGRDKTHCERIKAYAQYQGLFQETNTPRADYSEVLKLHLQEVVPSLAGPKRPQDRIALKEAKTAYQQTLSTLFHENQTSTPRYDPKLAHALDSSMNEGARVPETKAPSVAPDKSKAPMQHGAVVIAAITSCTNTSNPTVMIAAGLIAKAAHARGLKPKAWVKTSLAPGSQVVTDYLTRSGLMKPLEALGFDLVGYGCTTCIGNSGPLPPSISKEIQKEKLAVVAVLSGNRNFEGRIHPEVQHAFLASPPLVVIYALAGTMNIDLYKEPLGTDKEGSPVYLKDVWPTPQAIQETVDHSVSPELFSTRYCSVFEGNEAWKHLPVPSSEQFTWDPNSTYVKHPPYFEKISLHPEPIENICEARVLLKLGDSVTTDHISPAGSIALESPAGQYLLEKGISPADFNSYGSRRGNHEVMVRGTFSNSRIQNALAEGKKGGFTTHYPSGDLLTVFEAAERYQKEHVPLIVLAGKEYGSGSSRDWGAKGPRLLGIRAVIAESFERIHRSNLIGMGILPLQFMTGENADSLSLTGKEQYNILLQPLQPQGQLTVQVLEGNKPPREFSVKIRIDAPKELEYYRHGGILHYVLRQLAHA